MATQTVNLSANASDTLVATLNQKHKWHTNQIGIHAHGAFGGGDLTFKYSLDGGTTKSDLKQGSASVLLSSSDGFVWECPVSTGGQAITVYASLTGSTSPDIDVTFVDPNFGN